MRSLTALQEGEGLRIHTEVVTPAVWKLPLPDWPGEAPQQLELVEVPGGEYKIGSAEKEAGRDLYTQFRQKCEGVNAEAERKVNLKPYAMVRNPISQAQWRAVAALPSLERDISPSPDTYEAKGLWETYAQPGGLAVDSVSWNDCQEWLQRLNLWLEEQWPELGGQGEAPQLALPSESQWEAACRAGASMPFHFGNTLDASLANYDAGYTYGPGRKGAYRQRPVPMGFFGLVNRWGLAEMHGQLLEWCADQWHRSPIREDLGQRRGWFGGGGRTQELLDARAVEGPDRGLADVPQEQQMRLLRGGSWIYDPRFARAAFRSSSHPDLVITYVGVRPGCFSPPTPFNVRAVGRDSSGSTRRVTDPRVQTRSGDRRSPLARPAPSQRPHDPHNIGPLPHGPRPGLHGGLLLGAHTHHTALRHGRPATPAPAAWPRCALPAGSARRGRQSDRAARAAPRGDQPPPAGARCRWREGKPWGNRKGRRPCAPTRGIHRPARSGSTALLHRGSASAATASISMANVRGKAGPRRAPPQGGPWPLAPLGPHSTDTVPTPAAASDRGWSG